MKQEDVYFLTENLLLRVQKRSDIKTKIWWENYIKHDTVFRGTGIPKIREELKLWYEEENIEKISIDEQLNLALTLFSRQYSEDKIAGILLLQLYLYDKFKYSFLLSKFEDLFKNGYIFDWNVCDWFCIRVLGPMIELNGRNCAEAVSAWNTAENLWQVRASMVAFANIAKKKEYTHLLIESSAGLISREERFLKTAVGWILRELSRTDRKTVDSFIKTNIADFSKESMENAMKYFERNDKLKFRALFKESKRKENCQKNT